jgi:hypothetical protein
MQGFLLSKPIPEEQLLDLIKDPERYVELLKTA